MPSLRSTFWHLLALCILSFAVLNAEARPFPPDDDLLEARADSHSAASLGITPGNPAGKRFPFSKDIKDVDVKLWRSKSTFEQWLSPNEPLTKSEKAWLCVGPDCFGLSAVSTAVMQKVSGDLTEHLKESTTIGTMSFKSFVVKAAILTPVASGDNNIPGKDLGQLKSLLEQLEEANEECTGVKIFTGHAKFEAYYKKMKELGNSG